MQTREQQLLEMVRNAKNPEHAIITAVKIITEFLQTEKGWKENA